MLDLQTSIYRYDVCIEYIYLAEIHLNLFEDEIASAALLPNMEEKMRFMPAAPVITPGIISAHFFLASVLFLILYDLSVYFMPVSLNEMRVGFRVCSEAFASRQE